MFLIRTDKNVKLYDILLGKGGNDIAFYMHKYVCSRFLSCTFFG